MADELIKHLGSWVILVILMGSCVDCIQFSFLMRRAYLRWKRNLYRKVKSELLYEQHEKKD